MNINFSDFQFDPTENRTRVYHFNSRRSNRLTIDSLAQLQYVTDKINLFVKLQKTNYI